MNSCMFLMTEFTHDARVTKEARTLVKNGHSVLVVALKDKKTPIKEIRDNFLIKRTSLFTRYRLPKGNIFFFIKYIEYIIRTIVENKNEKFDVYHAHDLETLPVAFILSKINNKILIYDSHELYIEQDRHSRIRRWFWYQIEKFLSQKPFETFMETDSRGRLYAQRYGVKQPITLRNCQYLNFTNSQNEFRKILPIHTEEKIILYQGGIEINRGCEKLLDTMMYLNNNAVLIFLGDGSYKIELREKVKEHKKANKIYVLDAVPWEQLSMYTASADIGVFPLQNVSLQYYYALSNKLFEYLSAGLPVVFSDFPEMRKVIVDNNVGLVVDEKDPKVIAEAINKILNDKKLYKEMSQNAKRIIKEKYNWNIEAEKLLSIYKKIEKSAS